MSWEHVALVLMYFAGLGVSIELAEYEWDDTHSFLMWTSLIGWTIVGLLFVLWGLVEWARSRGRNRR